MIHSLYTNKHETYFINIGSIVISTPPEYKFNWNNNTARSFKEIYCKMGLEPKILSGSNSLYYNIPNSNYYIKPIFRHIYSHSDPRESTIFLHHIFAEYDGIYDAWSVDIIAQDLLEIEDLNLSSVLFNLDLFRGAHKFKWKEFPKFFEAYVD